MVDLRFDQTEQMLRDTAREVLSHVNLEQLLADEGSTAGYDPLLWEQMVGLGWTGLTENTPEASLVHAAIVLEETGRAGAASPLFQTLISVLVLRRLCGPTAAGLIEALIAGTDRAATVWSTEPARRPWAQSARGASMVIGTRAPVLVEWAQDADVLVVPAVLDENTGRAVVVRVAADTNGVEVQPVASFDNERMAAVSLTAVAVAASDVLATTRLSEVEDVFAIRDALRCAEMVGGARRALELAVEYSTGRVQFGRPLGSMQAVQHRCADMLIAVDGAWLTTYEALWLASTGEVDRRALAVAAYQTGQACEQVAVDAAQLTGGMGFMREFPLHVFYRRAKAQQLRLGSVVRRLDTLAEAALGVVGRHT